jgi:hypothetical protein
MYTSLTLKFFFSHLNNEYSFLKHIGHKYNGCLSGLLVGWDGTEKRIPWDDRLLFIPWDGMTLKIPHPTWDGTIFKKFLSHGMGRF